VLAETLGYTMWWASPAGMFAWVVLIWVLARLLGLAVRSSRVRRGGGLPGGGAVRGALVAAGTAAAIAAGATVALAEGRDYHLGEYRSIHAISAGLDRNLPPGATVKLLGLLGEGTFRLKMAARFALRTHGVRPLSPGIDVRLGSWYDLDHRRYRCTVYIEEGHRRPDPRAFAVARSIYGDGSAGQPVSAWVSPAGCRLRSARPRR
jgi:hypothetical protein